MPVYVDKLQTVTPKGAQARRVGNRWCHMTADSLDELHAMAEQIGMKREWFQPHATFPHYDLVPSRRARAVALGAIEEGLLAGVHRMLAARATATETPSAGDDADRSS